MKPRKCLSASAVASALWAGTSGSAWALNLIANGSFESQTGSGIGVGGGINAYF